MSNESSRAMKYCSSELFSNQDISPSFVWMSHQSSVIITDD